LDFYLHPGSLTNTEEDEKLEAWSDSYILVRPLRNALPFGKHLPRAEYSDFLDNVRPHLVEYAQEQLLYWHLARATTWSGHPITQIVLCEEDRYLWATHVPAFRQDITRLLGLGAPVYYLSRFRLSHLVIELGFTRFCLLTSQNPDAPPRLGAAPGDDFEYSWTTNEWRLIDTAPDDHIVNPRYHFFPPTYDNQPTTLPPSSLPRLTPTSTGSWTDPRPVIPECTCRVAQCACTTYPCICRSELCTCNYRPDTLPTPTEVTLWRPGLDYLPSH